MGTVRPAQTWFMCPNRDRVLQAAIYFKNIKTADSALSGHTGHTGLDLVADHCPCLEAGAAALHQEQLQVLLGLHVLRGLQGFVDPMRQFPSSRTELHKASSPSQQPQRLQVS